MHSNRLAFFFVCCLSRTATVDAIWWLLGISCRGQDEPVFGCSAATSIDAQYSSFGTMTCGGIYTRSETGTNPFVTIPTAEADSLYTLLLVDTSTSILHFAAVNVPGTVLAEGVNLADAPNVVSGYRGPSPPFFLAVSLSIYRRLFNYEWVLAKQTSGPREVPEQVSNFQFDYVGFLNETEILDTSFFSSGFCV